MEFFHAVILGVVEGLTEFLPISSTGHLIVAQDMLGFYDASKMFTVVIQMGAIAAVVWFYRYNLLKLARGFFAGDKNAMRFCKVWVLATIPAGLSGLALDVHLEKYVNSLSVAIALIAGGILIWVVEKYYNIPKSKDKAQLESITIKQAVAIGLYQILALVPGVSRSGATIVGGVVSGLDRVTATAFSFYLGIPILLIAGVYKLATDNTSSIAGGSWSLIIGSLVSFATSLVVIGWLLRYVSKNNLKIFAYYRVAFGILIIVLVSLGILD